MFVILVIFLAIVGIHAAPAPCPGGSKPYGKVPLPLSHSCRCFRRPEEGHPAPYVNPTPDLFKVEVVPFDPDFILDDTKDIVNKSVCVYFGQVSNNVPNQEIPETVIEAVNEHGWPVGWWQQTPFRDVCVTPTSLARQQLYNKTFFNDTIKCFRNDALALKQQFFSEGSKSGVLIDSPRLHQFSNLIKGRRGVTALFFFNFDSSDQPVAQKLRFAVEAYYRETQNSAYKSVHVLSPTYDVTYPVPADGIKLNISTSTVEVSLDYAYQTSRDKCLEKPPFPPPIPRFAENTCACFLRARQKQNKTRPGPQPVENAHLRLNLTANVTELRIDAVDVPEALNNLLKQAQQIQDRNRVNNITSFSLLDVIPVPGATHGGLQQMVIVYPMRPAYITNEWREREVVIQDMRSDTGMPVGHWLNPYVGAEKLEYERICNEQFVKKFNGTFGWIRPPYPAIGNCTRHPLFPKPGDTKQYQQPCYFHFHSDWYFVDCRETCDKPKFVCAVWQYDPATVPADKPNEPFEFQFIATSVFYKNVQPAQVEYLEFGPDADISNLSTCPANDGSNALHPVRPWSLMETHLSNYGYSLRSDVWKFRGKEGREFKRVDESSDDSDSIQHPLYFSLTRNDSKTPCVVPATFYLETKDNNLCFCTFWGANLVTWQTHYGRKSSCDPAKPTPFDKLFNITIHPLYQNPLDIKIRVGIISPNTLRDLNLVLHTVYLQAMDENGLPVGRFIRGHWIPPNPETTYCQNLYPRNNDEVLKRHPIFTVKTCPLPASFNLSDIYGNAQLNKPGNVFMLLNQWKDQRYDHVCAQFFFEKGNFPLTTKIQFMAFVRLEDYPGLNAYMIELRSVWISASNLSTANITHLNTLPPGQDPLNSKVLLNYEYFRKLQAPTPEHFHRKSCVEPPIEPKRVFELCRHYVTTPDTLPYQRWDLDLIIDTYNLYCVKWINAIRTFSEQHPYTVELAKSLKESKTPRDVASDWKLCFTLKAFKHKVKNSFHVMFRFDKDAEEWCWLFTPARIKEAALMALNERGYPIGYPFESDDHYGGKRGSFMLFNHFSFLGSGDGVQRLEFCDHDDIQLSLDDATLEQRMVHVGEKAKCFWSDSSTYAPNKDDHLMKFFTDAESPSLMIWANFNNDHNGFCAHWTYPERNDNPSVPTPKFVQFIMEVQIQEGTIAKWGPKQKLTSNLKIGAGIIVLRSPKYKFEYQETNQLTDRLDTRYEHHDCHQEEADIVSVHRPTEACVCKLTPLRPPTTTASTDLTKPTRLSTKTTTPTKSPQLTTTATSTDTTKLPQLQRQGAIGTTVKMPSTKQTTVGKTAVTSTIETTAGKRTRRTTTAKPFGPNTLCLSTYLSYNHRLDNRLYRTCLSHEDPRRSASDFGEHDCRVKIDYPTPPEVFPNELVFLTADGPKPVIPNLTLDHIDPAKEAFEGCGYIKECTTRYASRQVEEACLEDKSCDMFVAFGKALAEIPEDDEAILEIYAVCRGWAAVGISHDEQMGDDYVIECTKEGGEVNIYNSWNYRKDNMTNYGRRNLRLRAENSFRYNIRPVRNTFFEDKLYCKFYISEVFEKKDPLTSDDYEYDLKKPYFYIMAFSDELPEPYGERYGNIKTHVKSGANSETHRERRIRAATRYSPLPIKAKFFRVHALLHAFCWIFCMTISLFVARYYKETLVNTKYFRMNFWYFWHIFGVVIAGVCLFMAEIFRIWGSYKWENKFKSNFHKYAGYFCDFLFIFGVVSGLACKTKRKLGERKHIINFIHCVFGHVGYNLALIIMGLAARMPYGFLSCSYTVYIWVWYIIYVIIHAIMTYHYWWIDFILGRTIPSRRYFAIDVIAEPEEEDDDEDSIPTVRKSRKSVFSRRQSAVRPRDGSESKIRYVINEAPGSFLRTFFLVVLTVFMAVYVFWIARKLIGYPTHCYDFKQLKEFEHTGITSIFNG